MKKYIMKTFFMSLVIFMLTTPLFTYALFSKDFGFQAKGSDVEELQKFLNDKGYFKGPINGSFLTLTKSSLAKFQKSVGIVPAKGYFGPATRVVVNYVLNPQKTFAFDTSLVSLWSFDDAKGLIAVDSSSNNKNGALKNGPVWSTGKVGGALLFNGTNAYVATPITTNSNQGTVSLWVNSTASIDMGRSYTIFQANGNGNSIGLFLQSFSSASNPWQFDMRGNYGATVSAISPVSSNANLNQWHHLVAVWDTSSGVQLYVDGSLSATATGTTGTISPSTQTIGAPTSSFQGSIDDVRVYNRKLTSSEIAALYTETSGTTPSPVTPIILPPSVITSTPQSSILPAVNPIFEEGVATFLNEYNPLYLPGCAKYPTSILDYSRFTYDSDHNKMLMFGGGHVAVPRDDVDALDLNGSTYTWKSDYPSTPVSDLKASNYDIVKGGWISSGHPMSRHSYDMFTYASNVREMILLAPQNVGPTGPTCLNPDMVTQVTNTSGYAWHYNPVTKLWRSTALIDFGETSGNFANISEYDPVSGNVVIITRYGLYLYNPVSEKFSRPLSFGRGEISYAQNLVYYPPNQKMYLIKNSGDVLEVTLNRTDFTKSSITQMTGVSGSLPKKPVPTVDFTDDGETGWAYDSVNKIIGGGITNGVFYAFNPISKVWTASTMSKNVSTPIGTQVTHALDYDPVHNVFIFISSIPASGGYTYNTWAYRYGGGLGVPPLNQNPSPAPIIPTPRPTLIPAPDSQPPTAPKGVTVVSTTKTSISLEWSPSKDNVGVIGYNVMRNGLFVSKVSTSLYTDSNLKADTSYRYTISAYDAAQNTSSLSSVLNATTDYALVTLPLKEVVKEVAKESVSSVGTIPGPGPQAIIPETALHIADSQYTATTWRMIGHGIEYWKTPGGDFSDKQGTLQGSVPWATGNIQALNKEQKVTFDVTDLVLNQIGNTSTKVPSRGWIVKLLSGSVIGTFYSREYTDSSKRPVLQVTTTNGSYTISPGADVAMTLSSYNPSGKGTSYYADNSGANIGIWFDLSAISGTITSAKLTFTSDSKQYGGGTGTLGIFPVDLRDRFKEIPLNGGLSSKYTNDIGIEKDPDVFFADHFLDLPTDKRGYQVDARLPRSIVGDTDPLDSKYQPLAIGIKAYKMTIPKGEYGGEFGRWMLWSNLGYEPEELYTRAYMRMGTNFDSMGGKFPLGFDGTYIKYQHYSGVNPVTGRDWTRSDAPEYAGNGGNTSNGTNGWSARGGFFAQDCDSSGSCASADEANPFFKSGYRVLDYYSYHADQPDAKGDPFLWSNGYLDLIPKNKWVSVEHYVKLNTVNKDGSGNKDGILRVWIDGRLAFEKTDFRVRNWPGNYAGAMNIKVYSVWLNFYHGGLLPANSPMDVYMSDLVIAKSYIGPSNLNGAPAPLPPTTSVTTISNNYNQPKSQVSSQSNVTPTTETVAKSVIATTQGETLSKVNTNNSPQVTQVSKPVVSAVTQVEGTKFTRTLYRGMRGNDVLRLQTYLAKNTNYFSLIPNGYYGAATETAVKRFQLSNNIVTVTAGATLSSGYGVFGKKTQTVLLQVMGR